MYQAKISAVTHIGARQMNQDNFMVSGLIRPAIKNAFFYMPPKVFKLSSKKRLRFAVADGMGGAANGHLASYEAIKHLFKNRRTAADQKLFKELNAAVCSGNENRGTTLAFCDLSIAGNMPDIETYSIGDSLIFHYDRSEKTLQKINQLDNRAERDNVTGEDERKARSELLDFLGKNYADDIPFHENIVSVEEGDLIILASDGITSLDEEQIIAGIESNKYRDAALSLANAAVEKADQYCDNTTVIVIEIC